MMADIEGHTYSVACGRPSYSRSVGTARLTGANRVSPSIPSDEGRSIYRNTAVLEL